ncbi:MAG: hypothetical protein JRN15_09690 [Nitrososphaerota archaeon]|nr:hypothetical protein [Nitrososphaerota archaeon]
MQRAIVLYTPADRLIAERICNDISLSTVNVNLEGAEIASTTSLEKHKESIGRANLTLPIITQAFLRTNTQGDLRKLLHHDKSNVVIISKGDSLIRLGKEFSEFFALQSCTTISFAEEEQIRRGVQAIDALREGDDTGIK